MPRSQPGKTHLPDGNDCQCYPAHAEAAAMREALLLILEIMGNGGVMPGNGTDQCIDIAQKALASDAGRALVEELAAAKEALRVKTAEHDQTVRGFAEAERGYFDKNAALREELAAAKAEVCKLRDAVYGPREIVQALQRQARDAEADRDLLASELEAAKSRIAGYAGMIRQYAQDVEREPVTLRRMDDERAAAEHDRDRLARELGFANGRIDDLRQMVEEQRARAVKAEENLGFHFVRANQRFDERNAETARADAAERRVAELETLLRGANESLVHTRAWMHAETVPLRDADEFDRVDREAVARMLEIDAALAAPASEIHAQTITSVTGAGINRACPECNCISSHASHCSAAKDEHRAMERVIEAARLAIRQLAAIGINVKLATLEEALAALDAAWAKKEGE